MQNISNSVVSSGLDEKDYPTIGVTGLAGYSVFLQMSQLPLIGQTVHCHGLFTELGGKGYNQVVACGRLGVKACFAGAIGRDDWGQQCKIYLESEGVDSFWIEKEGMATAFAAIQTDAAGQNTVSVYPGAAAAFCLADLGRQALEQFRKCKLLLIQAELGKKHIMEVLDFGEEAGIPVILNPGPAIYLENEILARFYAVTPNEDEAKVLTGLSLEKEYSPEALVYALQEAGVKRAAVTLGDKGAIILENDENCEDGKNGRYCRGCEDGKRDEDSKDSINDTVCKIYHIEAYPINPVVDTTGAGDVFNGALAVGIVEGKSFMEAVHFAVAASGLSITKAGAVAGIPYREDVDCFLRDV